jgi:hypothetical protein
MLADVAGFALLFGPLLLLSAAVVAVVATVELWPRNPARAHRWLAVAAACVMAVVLVWGLGPSVNYY